MINNSDSFSISGGAHNVVYGNQIIHQVDQPTNQSRFRSGERWKEKIYREYERIRTGDLKLIRTIAETEVYLWDIPANWGCESDNAVRTKRVFQSACIVIGTQETRPSLSIKYTGRDAKKVFKADLLQFSRIKSPVVPQLRSFNDSDIPMIVFHDELIPASRVIEGAKNYIEISCYLHVQGNIARSNLLSSADSLSLNRMDRFDLQYADGSQLWIRPQTGQICLGPAVVNLRRPSLPLGIFQDSRDPKLPPLPLSMYKNLTFSDPVVKNTWSGFVLNTLCNECTSTYSYSIADPDRDHYVLSSSCRQPVARFTEISWSIDFYFHDPWRDGQARRKDMEDGRIRLTISDHRIPNLTFHCYTGKIDVYRRSTWLSQAAHVFNVLGTPREEWEDYALFQNDICLRLDSDIDYTNTPFDRSQCVDTQIDAPECYLFVLPPPQLPDTRPDVAAWCRKPLESLYYWSLDPNGNSVMPEAQRIALDLSSFHQSIKSTLEDIHWKAEIYDLARQWQEAQGFDPTTTDFARSRGYAILEILSQDDNRFEHCVEEDEVSMLVDSKNESKLEQMEVDEYFEIGSSSQGALLSQGQFEESSSMDVDMEDCSNLMADLRVETSLMDE
ncbi:hypothetical protein PQX77_012274 [Marasmius sp. AFHP31]|nr:hypothetical protein PQX77_012274 [Marasmius sp. AFHP31]